MKNLLIIISLVFFLSSCFNNKEDKNIDSSIDINDIAYTWDILTSFGNNISSESFSWSIDIYWEEIRSDFKLDGDLLWFQMLIDKDIWDDEIYYYLNRAYLFWDKVDNDDINKLISCLDWNISSELLSTWLKEICIWENKYIKDENSNNFSIKDSLLKLKEAKNNKDFSCNYFLEKDLYDYPKDDNHFITRDYYFICNKIKNLNTYDLRKELFYYVKALEINQCDSLKDKNLINLCLYEKTINNPKFKK